MIEETPRAISTKPDDGSPGLARPPWLRSTTAAVAGAWSLFQLHVAQVPTNAMLMRSVHLAFALWLAFVLFPSRRSRVGRGVDVALGSLAAMSALYIVLNFDGIASRRGEILPLEVGIGAAALVFLLIASWRALGPALAVISLLFLAYALAGPKLPLAIAHRGASVTKLVNHQYLTAEGVFGLPLGVSAQFVFLFVLFGALLERAGGGEYFIRVAMAALGGLRGGPAKAAVLASGLTGMVSGSSMANTVTTGTFTIPLMMRTGLPAHKAAAIEVAASTNGQLMPPVMGAAAFIIAEYLGVGYVDVLWAATIPAVASYVALFHLVHLESVKLRIQGVARAELPPLWSTIRKGVHYLVPVGVLVFYLVVMRRSPTNAVYNAILCLSAIMVGQRVAHAVVDPSSGKGPPPRWLAPPALAAGPVLVAWYTWWAGGGWVAAGAAGAAMSLGAGAVAHGLRGSGHMRSLAWGVVHAVSDIAEGLVAGARNMVPVAVATGAAGIIVGTITLTGVGQKLGSLIELISGGELLVVLLLVAVTSLILGAGLPTTANYIVMASLTAPVLLELAGDQGMVVPAVAAHLFVFYFGILADDTPPVGLAAYAAAAIAKSDPLRTGAQGFAYDIRTAVLPFMFFFNARILLIDHVTPDGDVVWITHLGHIAVVAGATILGMLSFVSVLQGWFMARSHWYESVALAGAAWVLLRPDTLASVLGGVPESLAMLLGTGVVAAVWVRQRSRRQADRATSAIPSIEG